MIDRSLLIFLDRLFEGIILYEGFEGIYYKSFVSFETYHRINYHSFVILILR